MGKSVTDLRKSVTDFGKISHRLSGNSSPFLENPSQTLEKICHRFWGNPSPILGTSATDMGKSATDFGKKQFHFWEKPVRSLGQTGFGFGKKTARFGRNLVWFLDWLGTKLKSHCFERLACLGLDLGI